MNITLMKTNSDCQVAALSTATQKSYDEVCKACSYQQLPLGLDNPLLGNPEVCYLALIKLGFWKRNINWIDLESRRAEVGTTIILIHNPINPILQQHYIVLANYCQDGFLVYWGDSEIPHFLSVQKLKDYYLKGWPNCAFQVIKDTAWLRFLRWIGMEK